MFLKSSKLSFWVSNLASNANARWGGAVTYCTSPTSGGDRELHARRRSAHRHRILAGGELFHHSGQGALRPDLDETVAAQLHERADARGPADRRPQLHLHHVRDAIAALVLPPREVGHHRQSRR